MLDELKQEVYEANIELKEKGLVVYTWGNVSGISREKGLVVIKPSGVDYSVMKPGDMVVVDLLDGRVVEGSLKPSSDTPTHLVLYRAFPNIRGIAHTHSRYAVQWAQAGKGIPCFGTTHADCFYGEVPCTRPMTDKEIAGNYEVETGNLIVETFGAKNVDYVHMPGVVVCGHGPFTWGKDPAEAVHNSVVLEEVAAMALGTILINPDSKPITQSLLDRHFLRKHGAKAYYGQG